MFLKKLITRKMFFRITLSIFVAFIMVACAPVVFGLSQLPEEGKTLILMLITTGLTWLFMQLLVWFGWNLGGYAQPLAAVLSPIVITIIEHYLVLIPAQYDDLVTWVIHLLVLLFGSVGTFFVVRSLRSKEKFKAFLGK